MQITEAEIAELERLCAEATPGPWLQDETRPHTVMSVEDGSIGGVLYNTNENDVPFIAAARTALPKLLSERREREGKLAELERLWDEMKVARHVTLTAQEKQQIKLEAAEATLAKVRK